MSPESFKPIGKTPKPYQGLKPIPVVDQAKANGVGKTLKPYQGLKLLKPTASFLIPISEKL